MSKAIDSVKARLFKYPTETVENIIREIGGGWEPCEYRRMVRACAYDVLEARHGIGRVDAIMAEVDPGYGAGANLIVNS